MDAKRLLRQRVVAARAARTAADLAVAEAALAEHGVEACERAGSVAAYAGVGTEPPTRALLDRLRAAGIAVLLPVIVDGELRWAPYDGWDRLVDAPFGLRQPAGSPGALTSLASVDLVLAPALAVDLRGNRLGRGKGYYDRALTTVAPERVIAVVYDDEVVDDVPAEPHDRRVGAVLTPSGVRRLDG